MSEVRITDPKTGGMKGQKAERFDLIPFDALEEVARVYSVGAEKYEDDNWLKGYRWRLSLGALIRHVARFMLGEDRDPETGCLHLAHAAWHCLAVITFWLRKLGTDDRAPPKQAEDPAPLGRRMVINSLSPRLAHVGVVVEKKREPLYCGWGSAANTPLSWRDELKLQFSDGATSWFYPWELASA